MPYEVHEVLRESCSSEQRRHAADVTVFGVKKYVRLLLIPSGHSLERRVLAFDILR